MFSFFLKKSLVKVTALTGAVLVLLTSFFFVSCADPNSEPVGVYLNAQKPVIETQPADTFWNVFTAASGVKLTVEAKVTDDGILSYQWYSNTSANAVNGTKIDTATDKDYTLTKTACAANGTYYFYVIVTNTNNDVTGTKIVHETSNVATVTVVGNSDTDYSDTHTMPSELTGEWESEWGEIFTISAGEFSSGADWGDGWSGYKGTIVNHRGNAEGTAGYITIQYTECTWDEDAEGKYYVVYYKDLTDTSVTISGAGLLADPGFGTSGGRANKEEAEATYTVSAGYFAMGSDLTKAEGAIHLSVTWELNDGEWETGSLHPGQILSGTVLAKPSPDPIRDWYDFGGWYSDAGLTTPYNFNANVTAPPHLYAKWEEAFWRITWHLNDGEWGASQTPIWRVDKGATVSKPNPDPAKTGFIFAGWYSDEGLATQYNFSSNVTGELNLYAKWNQDQQALLASIKADLTALTGGADAANPANYKVPAALNLDDNNWEGWLGLLQAIWDGGKKYLNLDLSDCAMTGTALNLVPNNRGGGVTSGGDHPKGRIVSIVLPKAATRIQSAAGANQAAFNFFINLSSVTGAEIITIDPNAFVPATSSGANLTTVNFPKAETIGANAFQECIKLTTVDLPSAKSFGNNVFQASSTTSTLTTHVALTITLGAAPPTVGTNLFSLAGNASNKKTVTVRVPSSASTAYGVSSFSDSDTATNNWGNAFKGRGWDGTNYLSGTVAGTITLDITTY